MPTFGRSWPCISQFERVLIGAAWVLTGYRLDVEEKFTVGRYHADGVSGGEVSGQFWRDTAIPLLWQRKQQAHARKFWQFWKTK